MKTLSHLHRNGTFARVREVSDKLEMQGQQGLFEELTQTGIDELGGIKGLLHLLADPDVQRGLRTLAVLPAHLSPKSK